jgi:hypothetical protein
MTIANQLKSAETCPYYRLKLSRHALDRCRLPACFKMTLSRDLKRGGPASSKIPIRALFDNTVEFLTMRGHPPTCMSGATGCSVDATPARYLMTEIRKQNEVAMRARPLQARKSGELSKEIKVDDYTRYLLSILAGQSIQAANGSTKAELRDGPSASRLLRLAVDDTIGFDFCASRPKWSPNPAG